MFYFIFVERNINKFIVFYKNIIKVNYMGEVFVLFVVVFIYDCIL